MVWRSDGKEDVENQIWWGWGIENEFASGHVFKMLWDGQVEISGR